MSNTVITDLFGHGPNPNPKSSKPATETDLEFARQNVRNQVLQIEEALGELMVIMKQSQHPRFYETYAILTKEYAEANKLLMHLTEIDRKTEYIEVKTNQIKDGSKPPTSINNNLFVGSTHDALKLIKAKKDE